MALLWRRLILDKPQAFEVEDTFPRMCFATGQSCRSSISIDRQGLDSVQRRQVAKEQSLKQLSLLLLRPAADQRRNTSRPSLGKGSTG